jgi:hypothetical protein
MFYIFYEVFLHTTSTIQYYRHYFKNPGNFSFNGSEGIFHFFRLYDPTSEETFQFNKKYMRLFMTEMHEQYRTNTSILSELDHWVYDNCRDGIDNKDIIDDSDSFKDSPFKYGICLRYYYNSQNKKYYRLEDVDKFKYPLLTNNGTNKDYSIGTVIEKCSNDSILTNVLGPCANESNIDDFYKSTYKIHFNVLTHEIRPGVYEESTYNFIYEISNTLRKRQILENNLYFSPLLTKFKFGIFLPYSKENLIYTFSDNYAEAIDKKESNNLLCVYRFYLANYGYIYKASYQTIYDSLYKIGGIFQLIYYLFFGINYIFNKYTIINDTKQLFFTLHNDEKINGGDQVKNFTKIVNRMREEQVLRDNSTEIVHNISHLNRRENNFGSKYRHRLTKNFHESSFFQNNLDNKNYSIFPFISNKEMNVFKKNNSKNFIDDEFDYENHEIEININNHYSNKIKGKKERYFSKFLSDNGKHKKTGNTADKPLVTKIDKNENDEKKEKEEKEEKVEEHKIKNQLVNNFSKYNFRLSLPLHDIVDKDILDFKSFLKKFFDYKKKSFIYEKMSSDKIGHFFTMKNYFGTLFLCYKKPKNYFLTLKNFRKKLLSEEHFFKTQNNLYLIEKCFELKETKIIDIVELYKSL